jgi:hypothetical protein
MFAAAPEPGQRAERVEKAHQEQREQHRHETELQHAVMSSLNAIALKSYSPVNGSAVSALGAWPKPSSARRSPP